MVSQPVKYCVSCGRAQYEVWKLVALGEGFCHFLCNQCIDLAHKIIYEDMTG